MQADPAVRTDEIVGLEWLRAGGAIVHGRTSVRRSGGILARAGRLRKGEPAVTFEHSRSTAFPLVQWSPCDCPIDTAATKSAAPASSGATGMSQARQARDACRNCRQCEVFAKHPEVSCSRLRNGPIIALAISPRARRRAGCHAGRSSPRLFLPLGLPL